MDQPITDYGAFLREARQAVAELNEMQQREGALNQQLNQSRRQLEVSMVCLRYSQASLTRPSMKARSITVPFLRDSIRTVILDFVLIYPQPMQ